MPQHRSIDLISYQKMEKAARRLTARLKELERYSGTCIDMRRDNVLISA